MPVLVKFLRAGLGVELVSAGLVTHTSSPCCRKTWCAVRGGVRVLRAPEAAAPPTCLLRAQRWLTLTDILLFVVIVETRCLERKLFS